MINNLGTYHKYIFERDGYKCFISGNSEGLVVHHIKPIGAGGTDEYDNLITLCTETHIPVAHGKDQADWQLRFKEYTSQFRRPDIWDEVMSKSREWRNKRNSTSKKINRSKYRNQLEHFKKTHNGKTPLQIKNEQFKKYLKNNPKKMT